MLAVMESEDRVATFRTFRVLLSEAKNMTTSFFVQEKTRTRVTG